MTSAQRHNARRDKLWDRAKAASIAAAKAAIARLEASKPGASPRELFTIAEAIERWESTLRRMGFYSNPT